MTPTTCSPDPRQTRSPRAACSPAGRCCHVEDEEDARAELCPPAHCQVLPSTEEAGGRRTPLLDPGQCPPHRQQPFQPAVRRYCWPAIVLLKKGRNGLMQGRVPRDSQTSAENWHQLHLIVHVDSIQQDEGHWVRRVQLAGDMAGRKRREQRLDCVKTLDPSVRHTNPELYVAGVSREEVL